MKPVVASLCLVLADNLGSNGIGQFMESFSATRPCRFCMGTVEDFGLKVVFIKCELLVVLLLIINYDTLAEDCYGKSKLK